jgi:hypothetical protein
MLALVASLLLSPALAEDSEFKGTEAPIEEEKKEPETKLSAEIGAVFATGNAIFYTVAGAVNASHEWDRNKIGAIGGINLGAAKADADGDGLLSQAERDVEYARNVQRYFVEARYDRFVSDKSSFYALAGAFQDPFAGYDLRSHEQLGYSRRLIKNDTSELVTELGFDWAQENYTDEAVAGGSVPYQDVFATRILIGGSHNFNDHVSVSNTFEYYQNVVDFNDVRILNAAAVSAAVNSKLSIKLSHSLIFDNVPVEGFVSLDQTTMATLVATIL